ncbi:MAG: restriction endonuclease subunit S [Candidatus Limivicinus sp.]|jgi:type I restriction enzyme S subunit
MDNSNKPEIRFKGFDEAWKPRKLGEIFKYEQPQNYIVKNTEYNDTNAIPVLTAGQSFILGYTDEKFGIKEANEINPVVIFDDFTTSSHYVDFPFKVKSSAMKLLTLNNSKDNIYCVFNALQGIKYVPVSHERHWISTFTKFYVLLPQNTDEQGKIGIYFKNLDHLITLNQHKYDKLVNLKKAMLGRMFPKEGCSVPEIRFKGFAGAWEKHKLKDLLIQRIEHQKISKEFPLLAFSYAEGVINPEDKKTNKRDFIMTDKFNKIFSKAEVDDIIYNPANVIHGAIHRNKLRAGVVSPIYKIFICNNVSPQYMGYRLHTDNFINDIAKYIEGTVIKLRTLSPEAFLNMTIEIPPTFQEQEKIGMFFDNLDKYIHLQQQKIDKFKNIKQALLDKMFV